MAHIYNYTVIMFNSSSNEVRTWIANVNEGVTCYCAALEESSGYANPCRDRDTVGKLNQSHYNLVVTRISVTQQCDTPVWCVSAANVIGKSVAAAARGGFPIGTRTCTHVCVFCARVVHVQCMCMHAPNHTVRALIYSHLLFGEVERKFLPDVVVENYYNPDEGTMAMLINIQVSYRAHTLLSTQHYTT